MGVTRLETFLHRNEPNAYCHEVNIETLARRYTEETGKSPVILVDGYYFLYTAVVYRNKNKNNNWLMGGQLNECITNIKKFISSFKAIGAELIFYFDTNTAPSKRSQWVERRAEKLRFIRKIYDDLKGIKKLSTRKMQYISCSQLPILIGATAPFMIQYACGGKVRVAVDDCDLELATFANRGNYFAILSQDTDFLVMEGAHYYLSCKHLNWDTLTTVQYDGKAFAEEFSLNFNQLPLLATLLGNDCLQIEDISDYHLRIANLSSIVTVEDTYQLITAIAGYVRDLPTGDELTVMLPAIATEQLQNSALTEALQDGVKSYLASSLIDAPVTEFDDSNWKEILLSARRRHVDGQVPSRVYSILQGEPFTLSQSLEDMNSNHIPCGAVAYQPLRRRIFSILLKEKPGDNVTVEEWCIYPYEQIEGKIVPVEALPDGMVHPGLLALWHGSTPDILAQRWEIFVQSASPKLNTSQVRDLPMHLVVPTLVLSYILQECANVLEDWEVDAILSLAVVRDSTDMDAVPAVPVTYSPPARAVQCATLYSQGIISVLFLAATCGLHLDKLMPWHYFEGNLFLDKYLKANSGISRKALCNHQPKLLAEFLAMHKIIFSLPSPPHQNCKPHEKHLPHENYHPHEGYQPRQIHQPRESYRPYAGYRPQGYQHYEGHQPNVGYQPRQRYQQRSSYQPHGRYPSPISDSLSTIRSSTKSPSGVMSWRQEPKD